MDNKLLKILLRLLILSSIIFIPYWVNKIVEPEDMPMIYYWPLGVTLLGLLFVGGSILFLAIRWIIIGKI